MKTKNQCAVIVIDSGFHLDVLRRAQRIIGVYDLESGMQVEGTPEVEQSDIAAFAGDPINHGTLVLEKLLELVPEAAFILVRAVSKEQSFLRTEWNNEGNMSRPGWSEAYRWAVQLARKRGLSTVANCSFGGYYHAMDGTGWESFQLEHEAGEGKPGHIVVAAAGAGDLRGAHASWQQLPGQQLMININQYRDTRYNFWVGRGTRTDWRLRAWLNGEHVLEVNGEQVPPNLWNHRQQVNFGIEGTGRVQLSVQRGQECNCCGNFDCWVVSPGSADFVDYIDQTLVAEPAVFPHVLSVGLRNRHYAPNQTLPGCKPDILLPGEGAVSFRTPEVTAAVTRLFINGLNTLDVNGVRALLGKYPDVQSLATGE